MGYTNFNSMQLDALKEVSNIGAGNAATSLSMMMSQKIDMTVPAVNIVRIEDVIELNSEEEVAGIVVRALGDIAGNILLLFNGDRAKHIIEKLLGKQEDITSELGKSVLCEIANIVAASYMNAIAKFTNMHIIPSVPAVAYDMLSAILTTTFAESCQYDENILDIETIFLDDTQEEIGAHFYYVPMPGSLEKILKSIGVN